MIRPRFRSQRIAPVTKQHGIAKLSLYAACYGAILTALIYAPVGLSMMGLIEEWDIFYYFKKFGSFYIADAASPLPTHRLRPLTLVPFTIGYDLAPLSFPLLHTLQALSLVAKVVAMTAIIYRLIPNRTTAIVCGLIFLIFPADTMQMSLRSLHINWALALSLAGVALILQAAELKSVSVRWTMAAGGAISFLCGSLMYEAGLFLAPLPLLIWWAAFGFARTYDRMKRDWDCVLTWSTSVIAAATYVVAISLSGHNYQMEVTGDHQTIVRDLVLQFPFLFSIAFYRLFVYGWLDGVRMLGEHLDYWPYYLGVLALFGSTLIARLPASKESLEARPNVVRLLIAGLVAAAFGYLPYLTSFAHIMTSQRTFLYASIGGTIVLAACIHLVARAGTAFAVALSLLCVSAGIGSQWEQMALYTDLSNRQRAILAGILQAAPQAGEPGAKRLLILDSSGTMNHTWMLRGPELQRALTLLYDSDIAPFVCLKHSNVFSSFEMQPSGRPAMCRETEDGWDVGLGLPGHIHLSKASTTILTVSPDLSVSAAPPSISPSSAKADRWRQILGCWPATACAYKHLLTTAYDYDFGRGWGLDDVPWGYGWREIEWHLPSLMPFSWSWITAPKANLWLWLDPAPTPYKLRISLATWLLEASKDSLRFKINGMAVQGAWVEPRTIEAKIPAGFLKYGLNELEFEADQDQTTGLSVAVDRVSVFPDELGTTK